MYETELKNPIAAAISVLQHHGYRVQVVEMGDWAEGAPQVAPAFISCLCPDGWDDGKRFILIDCEGCVWFIDGDCDNGALWWIRDAKPMDFGKQGVYAALNRFLDKNRG